MGLPLDHFPIFFSSKMFATKLLYLTRCPMGFTFLFITVVMIFILSPIFCKMVSFFFLSVQLVLVIFLKIHVSIVSNLSFLYFFIIVLLHLCSKILQIYDPMKLFLVSMLKFFFVNKNFFFSNDCFTKAIFHVFIFYNIFYIY